MTFALYTWMKLYIVVVSRGRVIVGRSNLFGEKSICFVSNPKMENAILGEVSRNDYRPIESDELASRHTCSNSIPFSLSLTD